VKRLRGLYPAALVPILLGIGLHLYEHAALSDNGFSPGFFLWAAMPYGLCMAGLALRRQPLAIGFAATLALAADLVAHYSVFFHPTSSTAPLILLFMPLYNALLWIPAGLLLERDCFKLNRNWDSPVM
jgi:hypothetical protein